MMCRCILGCKTVVSVRLCQLLRVEFKVLYFCRSGMVQGVDFGESVFLHKTLSHSGSNGRFQCSSLSYHTDSLIPVCIASKAFDAECPKFYCRRCIRASIHTYMTFLVSFTIQCTYLHQNSES